MARRSALSVLTVCLAMMALDAATAGAQTAPVDSTAAPTQGALYQDGPTDRWLLGGQWLYRADPSDAGIAAGYWRNFPGTDGWTPVAVPNSFNAGDLSQPSMTGSIGWYRRDFTLPPGAFSNYVPARFRSWIVRFESVNYRATVWLNGRQIGSHAGAYLPFEFDLKGVRPGVNRLVVRVDDRRTGADLPPGPSGGWWNFGGLQREVYLRSVQRVDMSPVVVRPVLPCPTCAATIQEQVSVRNVTGTPQTVSLQGTYGAARLNFGGHTVSPHGTWVAHASVPIAAPHLWAPDDPHLYTATITASDQAGRRLETYVTHSGIRNIAVAPTGQLLLNGRVLNLRGFSIHEQNLQTGAALDPTQLAALVNWDRELGGGILRAHYPLNPEIEEMADRDGILLWSEVPVYQVATKFLTRPGWLRSAHAFLRDNILTNQNHPSVLLWSVGNELATPPNDAEARYIAGAAALAHQLDPTRPVGMAIEGWPGVACQQAYAPLDVIGYNDYFGWFDSGGGTDDDRDALSPYLDSLHACYPSKALMITEFGFEGNRDGPVEERGTFAYQAATAAFHLNVFASKPYISAAMWFAMQDFAARPGWGGGDPLPDPPFVQKGPIDINGNPREPLFQTLQSIYTHTQQIGPVAAAARRHRHRARRGR
jgi:beta-glucuronidase